MNALAGKISAANECSVRAWLLELDAHAVAFALDELAPAGEMAPVVEKIREAVAAHRDAINLLVAAMPESMGKPMGRR